MFLNQATQKKNPSGARMERHSHFVFRAWRACQHVAFSIDVSALSYACQRAHSYSAAAITETITSLTPLPVPLFICLSSCYRHLMHLFMKTLLRVPGVKARGFSPHELSKNRVSCCVTYHTQTCF